MTADEIITKLVEALTEICEELPHNPDPEASVHLIRHRVDEALAAAEAYRVEQSLYNSKCPTCGRPAIASMGNAKDIHAFGAPKVLDLTAVPETCVSGCAPNDEAPCDVCDAPKVEHAADCWARLCDVNNCQMHPCTCGAAKGDES